MTTQTTPTTSAQVLWVAHSLWIELSRPEKLMFRAVCVERTIDPRTAVLTIAEAPADDRPDLADAAAVAEWLDEHF